MRPWLVLLLAATSVLAQHPLTPKEALGKALFFDARLSQPAGQSCASCHDPRTGWMGPTENLAGPYEGAVKGRFGNRKPPTAAYAGWTPKLHRDGEGKYVGGLFWDGRATGHKREILAEQAEGPFLNPLEQALPDRKALAERVRRAPYAADFARVWKLQPGDWANADRIFRLAADAIAAYERSKEVNPFDSRFDDFWRAAKKKGLAVTDIRPGIVSRYAGLGLSEQELRGLAFFHRKGKCSECHTLNPGPSGTPPLFTDFTYDNLGIPKNTENPFYAMPAPHNPDGKAWVDPGLGATLKALPGHARYAAANHGKHRVPTLRNVDKRPTPAFTKVFGHNGFFKSLEHIVTFYNRRDSGIFQPSEVTANVNNEELGNLGLSLEQEAAIVAFMKTLTDRTTAQPPK